MSCPCPLKLLTNKEQHKKRKNIEGGVEAK
jgi:hypothetical protein